jgi:hypothetical protein
MPHYIHSPQLTFFFWIKNYLSPFFVARKKNDHPQYMMILVKHIQKGNFFKLLSQACGIQGLKIQYGNLQII